MYRSLWLTLTLAAFSSMGCSGNRSDFSMHDDDDEPQIRDSRPVILYDEDLAPGWSVDEAIEASNVESATLAFHVARGARLNAASNMAGPGSSGTVPMAVIGDRCHPVVGDDSGKWYLAEKNGAGVLPGKQWQGQVIWVNHPRALADAAASARVKDRIAQDTLNREWQRERLERMKTEATKKDIRDGIRLGQEGANLIRSFTGF